jgi:hypothetical protein
MNFKNRNIYLERFEVFVEIVQLLEELCKIL